jgi:hypothetical protein
MARATTTTAAVTGAYCGVVLVVTAPLVDRPGPYGTVWLLLATALVTLPTYLFVFGLSRKQLVGVWVLHPPLLKRMGAWFLCCGSVAAAASLVLFVLGA